MKMAWITWESQVRNRSMSRSLGANLHELTANGGRFRRYLVLTFRTFPILSCSDYQVLFTQNPSILLSLLNVVIAKATGKYAIVDAHNAGVHPSIGAGNSKFLNTINNFVIRHADYVIVSNRVLAEVIERRGGSAVVLPDPIPLLSHRPRTIEKRDRFTVLFVCSWATDEPYFEVIEAARSLPECLMYVTGNYKKKLGSEYISRLPENVELTGYIPDAKYEQLLQSVDVVIDLTTRDNCMVCGAYEAAAAATPAILSDHTVNREYFAPGYIYTRNNTASIISAIRDAERTCGQLRQDIRAFSESAKSKWTADMHRFLNVLTARLLEDKKRSGIC